MELLLSIFVVIFAVSLILFSATCLALCLKFSIQDPDEYKRNRRRLKKKNTDIKLLIKFLNKGNDESK